MHQTVTGVGNLKWKERFLNSVYVVKILESHRANASRLHWFTETLQSKGQNRIINVTTPESFLWVREFQDTRPLGFLFLPLLPAYRGRACRAFLCTHRVHLCGSCAVSSCSKMMAVRSLMLQVHLELMGASATVTLNGYSPLNPWLCPHIFACKRLFWLQDRGSHPLGEEKDCKCRWPFYCLIYFISLCLFPLVYPPSRGNSAAGCGTAQQALFSFNSSFIHLFQCPHQHHVLVSPGRP